MQRHKKWLIITIWISTIAFVGAGFVGWGQYSYGDKAGAVAKVGNIEISKGELQKAYSNLYMQYNQMFQGNFDEEQAKQFGLQKQALQQLVQQALVVNLAHSYDLIISDAELVEALQKQDYFFKDGVFDKETYKNVLAQSRLTTKEYEADLKKNLLIVKTLELLPVEAGQNEKNILQTLASIADKINYTVLDIKDVKVDTSDAKVKAFWETKRQNFMSEVSYDIKYITQEPIVATYSQEELTKHYNVNRTHFKDTDGKILDFEAAKDAVRAELNSEATKDKALRNYIDYKKGELNETIEIKTATVSQSNNPFSAELLEKITQLSPTAPYLKPVSVNGVYHTVELVKTNPSVMKTYEEAKAEIMPLYIQQEGLKQLLALANESLGKFSGKTTDFVTVEDTSKITQLTQTEAKEFLGKLFTSDKKRSFIQLSNNKVVLYNILEQKLLSNTNKIEGDEISKFKSAMFNEALIKELQNKYPTEIYMQGL